MGRLFTLLFCILTTLLSGSLLPGEVVAATNDQWDGREEVVDGSLNVINAADPQFPLETIKARELWRIGDEEDDSGELLGFITDVKRDQAGNYYLLDRSLSVLKVYSPSGEFIKDLSREGEGPGEIRQPGYFSFLDNGNIAISQMMPGRLITIDPEGIPTGNIPLAEGGMGMHMLHKLAGWDGFTVASLMVPNFSDGQVSTTQKMFSVNGDGEIVATYYDETDDQSGSSNGGGVSISMNTDDNDLSRHWTVGTDGQVYCARKYGEYEIDVFSADGKKRHVIQREYESIKRPKEEIEQMEEEMAEISRRFTGGGMERDINPWARDIENMFAQSNGELWVETSVCIKDSQVGGIRNLDVYDNNGRFLHQLSIDVDYDAERDDYIIDGDRLYVLKEAKKLPGASGATTFGGHGGGAVVMSIGGGSQESDEDDDEEALAFAVVCYDLSN